MLDMPGKAKSCRPASGKLLPDLGARKSKSSSETGHSRICFTKHTEKRSITPSEKACLSASRRRPCPSKQGDLLERERGDLLDQLVRS